ARLPRRPAPQQRPCRTDRPVNTGDFAASRRVEAGRDQGVSRPRSARGATLRRRWDHGRGAGEALWRAAVERLCWGGRSAADTDQSMSVQTRLMLWKQLPDTKAKTPVEPSKLVNPPEQPEGPAWMSSTSWYLCGYPLFVAVV